jgi:hypothetical protein
MYVGGLSSILCSHRISSRLSTGHRLNIRRDGRNNYKTFQDWYKKVVNTESGGEQE